MRTFICIILLALCIFLLVGNKTITKERTYTPEEQNIINTWEYQEKNVTEFGYLAKPPYWRIIRKWSEKHGVDPHLVVAVIKVESGFNPRATSYAGAKGLMQIMPKYHYCKDYFNPEENIKVGTKLLAGYIKEEGDLKLALRRYNSGYRKLNNGYDGKVLAYYLK